MELNASGLENDWVRLEPLQPSEEVRAFLKATGAVEAMWNWLPRIPGRGTTFDIYYDYVIANMKKGEMVPFLAYDAKTGDFVGGSNFLNPNRTHRNVQIGFIWTTPEARGSNITLAAQMAMIQRAVDWRAKRVYWFADLLNEPYMAFLEGKIGARKEGEMECVARMNDGRWADAAVYALVGDKLKEAPARLQAMLETMD